MPNDLTAKRNLLNSRSESQRQKLTSSGFTASIWTISGVVLVACGTVEDFLGLDDGGGGGGRSVHVQSSAVQGARLYFDADDDGTVSPEERAAQDAQHPQGFVTNENGEATGIPGDLYGKAFVAVLDGAFDADTGAEFPANTEYQSIPNAAGDHLLASPITDYVANQLAENLMPEEVDPAIRAEVAELLGLDPADTTNADQIRMAVNALLDDVSDHTRYDGSSGVDVLARYLTESTRTTAEVVAEVARVLGDNPAEALRVTSPSTLPPVMIGEHDTYIATIEAESLVHAVSYSIESADSGAFTVSNSGVISVREGMTPTEGMTTLSVAVTSGGTTQMVEVAVTFTTNLPELTPPTSTSTEIGEDTAAGTALISGIMAPMGIDADDFVIRVPSDANLAADLAANFDIMEDGGTFNLVLATGANLDYEAIPGGEGARTITLQVQAKNSDGVSSEPLTLTVMVTGVNEAPVFTTTGQNLIAEIPETQTAANGTILTVEAVDADGDSANNAVRYAITGGTGMGMFFIDRNTGAIRVADGVDFDYDTDPATSYTLTITATEGGDNPPADALTDTATVTITVTDANDIVPMVMPPSQGSTFRVRTTDGLSDAEIAQKSAASTGYSITIIDADTVNDFTFGVSDRRFEFVRQPNSDVWDLVLLAGQAVPEQESQTATPNTITLTYYVDDGANRVPGGTVTLEVVATPVEFTSPATRTIPLNENNGASLAVATVTATSSDDNGAPVHIQSFTLVDDFGGIFDIATSNLGTATAQASITITNANALDFETAESYTLEVLATDMNSPAETNTLTLTVNVQDVNDNSPIFVTNADDPTLSTGTEMVDENAGQGHVVARVRAMDADGTDRYNTVTYSITAGNPGNVFDIDPNSGVITVLDADALDYEDATFYALTITASDNQDGSIDAVEIITVNIGDVNDESPDVPNHVATGSARITAAADNPVGGGGVSMGYTVTVTDADADASTLDVSVGGATSDRFEFRRQPNTNTWELYLKAGEAITEAVGALIPLSYTVTDNGIGTNSVDNTFTLEAIDSPIRLADADGDPVSSYTAPVDEDASFGEAVVRIFASVDEPAQGSTIRYNFVGTGHEDFDIVRNSGIIGVNLNPLDYETTPRHELTVRVTYDADGDIGTTSDQETRDVDVVIDVNNVDETGTRTYEIMQSADPLVVGSMLTAQRVAGSDEDPDGVDEDSIEYVWLRDGNVISGETDATYEITANPESIYTVQVSYLDGYNAALPTAQQTRTEIEASTSPIKFSQAPVDIDEDQGPTKFVTLMPSVDDAGTGHTFSFAYVTGTDTSLTNLFDLGATSGEIKVGGTLDRDVTGGDRYVLPITITYDPDGPSSTVGKVETRNVNVVVNVGDVNDNEAEFAASTYSASVAEDATTGPTGTLVFTAVATDDDATPEYSNVRYAIKGGTGMSLFDIDAETGEIRAKSGARLNFDATTSNPNPIRSYSLEIIARDGLDAMGMEALTEEDDTTTVTIRITDVNDNAPNIVVADPSPSVTERTASADTDIITGITVTDGDSDKRYAQGDFELTGDSRFEFVWDATARSGSVVLTSGSTIAPNTTISLSLTVTDANPVGHSGTDTETLTIMVTEKPPLVSGGNTGTATQYDPSAADASGTLTYTDAALVKATPADGDYTATDGTYGTATVDKAGAWTYNVNNTHADVKALASGATLTDTFTISVPLAAGGKQAEDVTVTITGVSVVEGTANADTGAAPGNLVNRAAATAFEVIYGSHEDDVITVGTEGAVVFGGYGDDTINLRNGKTDIVVYRFSSIDGGSWRADDGGDIINNFERDKDIFILVDDDATPIGDLATFLSRATSPFVPSTLTAADEKPNFLGPVEGVNFSSFEFQFPAKYDVDGPGDLTKTTDPNVVINWATPVSQADAVTQGLINDNTGDGWDSGSALITDSDNVPNWFTTDIDTHVGLVIMTSDQLAIDIL